MVLGFGDVMDSDEVFVGDLECVACFGEEALSHFDVSGPVVGEDFDCYVIGEDRVVGAPHGCKRACAYDVDEFVAI